MFQPRFTLTALATRSLMAIEADRQVVAALPLSVGMLDSLRRTARLLSTHFSTQIEGNRLTADEVHAVVEEGLTVGKSHNYYFGRAEGDVTPFVEYFCVGMAAACAKVRAQAERASRQTLIDQTSALRTLTPQQRDALGLFLRSRIVTSKDIAAFFKLTPRSSAALCGKWVKSAFLVIDDHSRKARRYRLAETYEALVAAEAAARSHAAR